MTQLRAAIPTISVIDQYCSQYQKIFPEVRSYEAFKRMLLGIITPSQRKSLTTIGEIVGLKNSQSLHNFITESPWSYQQLRSNRLKLTKEWLSQSPIDIIIDETGDRKKGTHTDYVARQYLGRLGKVDNGIVSVNIYGVKDGITFPLIFEIYKPKATLKSDDIYQSKPQIAAKLVTELVEKGFNIRYVLADSCSEVGNIYGESTWVEYGFRQCKSELGWSDFRLTKYLDIARWWEIIFWAFLLVSFQSLPATISESLAEPLCWGKRYANGTRIEPKIVESELKSYLAKHPNWDKHRSWKSALNNLQLLLLPLLAFNLIKPWLTIFSNPLLEQSFSTLIAFVDLCTHAFDSLGLLSVHPFCSD